SRFDPRHAARRLERARRMYTGPRAPRAAPESDLASCRPILSKKRSTAARRAAHVSAAVRAERMQKDRVRRAEALEPDRTSTAGAGWTRKSRFPRERGRE